jgi:hypothetical protein
VFKDYRDYLYVTVSIDGPKDDPAHAMLITYPNAATGLKSNVVRVRVWDSDSPTPGMTQYEDMLQTGRQVIYCNSFSHDGRFAGLNIDLPLLVLRTYHHIRHVCNC